MTEPEVWARRLTSVVGSRIKHFRETRGLSARALADLTEEVGYRVQETVIANMEVGRRRHVPLAELHVLADALRVPVALLVVPLGEEDDFPVLPGREVDPWQALTWFTGSGMGRMPGAEKLGAALLLSTYRRHDEAVARYRANRGDTNGYLDSLLNVRAELRGRGWRLPRLPEDIADVVQSAERERELSSS